MAANKSTSTKHQRTTPPKPEAKPITKAPENETVVVVAARCVRPSCRSTDVAPIEGIPVEVSACNTTVRGLPVTHIVRERMCCKACGQRFVRLEHQNRKTPADR